jgi:hypothetical protein
VDLDAAPGELLRGVVAEARGISGRIFGAASTSTQRWRAVRSRGYQRSASLTRSASSASASTRVAGADEDEAEMGGVEAAVRLGVCSLQLAQDPVAKLDRVGEILEPDACSARPRHREGARNGADREHELVVANLEGAGVRCLHHRRLPLLVDPVTLPSSSSAWGAICRSGTTACRGSSVPEAASGSIGV